MNNPVLIAVLAGLGGMLGWGLADLFAKKAIDRIGDITTLVVAHFFGAGFLALVTLYKVLILQQPIHFPTGLSVWMGIVFFGVLQGIVYLLVYIGFGKGQIAVLNPVFASFTGAVALISVLFLGEHLTGVLVVGLAVVFLGIMLMNIDANAFVERRISFMRVPGFTEVITATVLAAVWTLGWNFFVSDSDWFIYTFCMYIAMTVALTIYALVRKVSLKVTDPSIWKFLVCIGVFESLAYVAISWGYGATSATSIVAVLSGAFSLPTIIGGRLWLKETTTRLQLIGSVSIIAGIVLIALV